jgi:membrane-associated phospholipid phosphatase
MLKKIFYDFNGCNVEIFQFINKLSNVGIFPDILDTLCDFFRIWTFAVYYALVCIFQYYKIKSAKGSLIKKTFDNTFDSMFMIGMCYAFFGLTYAALKFSISLPRPYCSMPLGSFTTIADTASERCLSGFPSAHTGLALMIAFFLWNNASNKMKALLVLLVTLVAIGRITLAMHYPADILYSIIITIFIIKISQLVFFIFYNSVIILIKQRIFIALNLNK